MTKINLDRSFDNSNTYIKRKIPIGRRVMNIYKPRKADIRRRSQEKVINNYFENAPGYTGFENNNKSNYSKYKKTGNNILNRLLI